MAVTRKFRKKSTVRNTKVKRFGVKPIRAKLAELPPAHLPENKTHVTLAKAVKRGKPNLLQSREIRAILVKKFAWDFNANKFDKETRYRLATLRAAIWWRLFSSSVVSKRWTDLNQAKIGKAAFHNLKHHICPLGFKSRQQLACLMQDLHRLIPQAWGPHTIVLAGSSTTFYSENPTKTKPDDSLFHYFDKNGPFTGDYDLAISFDNPSVAAASLGKPSLGDWGSFWGTSAVTSVLDLKTFYAKWGHHPFKKFLKSPTTILKRDIGILILNYSYNESGTRCSFWKKDYVWSSSIQDFIKPKYGVFYAEAKGQQGGGKARGRGGKVTAKARR